MRRAARPTAPERNRPTTTPTEGDRPTTTSTGGDGSTSSSRGGERSAPTDERRSDPTEEWRSDPTDERRSASADGRRSAPTDGERPGLADGPTPELPDLDPGVRLLSTDEETAGALYSLVVDHLLRTPGRAWWVDAGGRARTRRLASVAPSGGLLDRIRVARGFTAFQHLALVETLGDRHGGDRSGGDAPDPEDPGTAAGEPALVVAPAIDAPYRADDLRAEERRRMIVRALAVLSGIARRRDCPVLVTLAGDGDRADGGDGRTGAGEGGRTAADGDDRAAVDGLAAPVEAAARERIRCAATPEGPRFVADGFETTVYPVERGWVQTTFAFWRRVLRARAADRALEPGATGTGPGGPRTPAGPAAAAEGPGSVHDRPAGSGR